MDIEAIAQHTDNLTAQVFLIVPQVLLIVNASTPGLRTREGSFPFSVIFLESGPMCMSVSNDLQPYGTLASKG